MNIKYITFITGIDLCYRNNNMINNTIKRNLNDFFKSNTIYDVVIPKNLSNKLDSIIFNTKDGAVAKKRKDKVMLLLSEMVNKHQSQIEKHNRTLKSIPIHNSKWIEIAGRYAYYQELEQLLIDNKIIYPYLNFKGKQSYKADEYARGYYINESDMDGDDVRIKLSKPLESKVEPSEQIKWLVESYKDLNFPSLEEVIEESYNQIGKKTKRNQIIIPHWVYVLLDDKSQYVDINEHISKYEQLIDNGLQEPRYQSNGRIIESISTLPSWIRDKMIKMNNKYLIRCDYKALHHNEWSYLINKEIIKRKEVKEYKENKNTIYTYNDGQFLDKDDKVEDILDVNSYKDKNTIKEYDNTIYTYNDKPFFPEHEIQWWNENCTGDGHKGIARALLKMEGNENPSDEEINETREYVKLESLSHYNKTKYSMIYNENKEMNRMAKLFKQNCIHIWWFIRDTKNGPYGYCNTSRLLTKVEQQIIQTAILKLKEENIKCVYVHDCLMVEEGNEYKCQEIMNNIVIDMGIPTYAEISR